MNWSQLFFYSGTSTVSMTNQMISADVFTIVVTAIMNGIILGLVVGLFVRATYWIW